MDDTFKNGTSVFPTMMQTASGELTSHETWLMRMHLILMEEEARVRKMEIEVDARSGKNSSKGKRFSGPPGSQKVDG